MSTLDWSGLWYTKSIIHHIMAYWSRANYFRIQNNGCIHMCRVFLNCGTCACNLPVVFLTFTKPTSEFASMVVQQQCYHFTVPVSPLWSWAWVTDCTEFRTFLICVSLAFLWVPWFHPTSQKHASRLHYILPICSGVCDLLKITKTTFYNSIGQYFFFIHT